MVIAVMAGASADMRDGNGLGSWYSQKTST
jgi:hypothetical protein